MANVLQRIQNAFSRAGGACSIPRSGVDCAIVAMKNATKPLQFIKEVKRMMRILLDPCEATFRLELAIELKNLYNGILKCRKSANVQDTQTGLQIGERGLSSAPVVKLCSMDKYLTRNDRTFMRRSVSLENPTRALAEFRELAAYIQSASQTCDVKISKLPCELTYFPKNENGCQLAKRTHSLIKGQILVLPK